MCGRCVRRVAWSRLSFTVLVCVWMLPARSGVLRVCLVRLVCVARKALQVWMAVMVLTVRLGWLALLVRRVLLV